MESVGNARHAMKHRIMSLLVLGVLCGSTTLWSQVSTSRIEGAVVDSTGATVPGAKVTATNEGTNVSYTTTTTAAGSYSFPSLVVGSYSIQVEAKGFKKWESAKNELTVGTPLVVNASLEVGAVTTSVQVEASAQRLETTNATISGVVTHQEVVELPLNGRNPLTLIILEPGLVQRTNSGAGSDTHVFGSRDRAHNITVDGIDANESSVPNPQSNILRLTPDNVQEYRVITHDATPEYGRNSGANVTIATRSGSNDFHGDIFYFHRNTALNSNEWFNDAISAPKPVLLLHQWGFDLGGPIKKDKSFFFGSYQGTHDFQTIPITASFGTPTVYTSTAKSGLFRYFVVDKSCIVSTSNCLQINGKAVTGNSNLLVDSKGNLLPAVPLCSGLVTSNCVATYSINAAHDPLGIGLDPKIQSLVGGFPLPNTYAIGDGLNIGGFNWNPPSLFKGPFYMVRVDHIFNDTNNVFIRYNWSTYNTRLGDLLNSRPQVFPGFPPLGDVSRANQNMALSFRHTFSPNLVNEFTTGYNRFKFFFRWGEANPNFGDFTKDPPYADECAGSSFLNIDSAFCDASHTTRAVSTVQLIDNLSWVKAAHQMRMGFNFRFYRHNDSRGFAGGNNISPVIYFNEGRRPPTFLGLPSSATTKASGISSTDDSTLLQAIVELAGIPANLNQNYAADFNQNIYPPGALQVLGTRAKQFDSYWQDEWHVRRNLTMTYGLRWEFNLPMKDAGGRSFVPNTAVDGSQGTVTFVKADRWYKRNNSDALAPRISFAWTPREKTVVRAGYGIAFDTISTFQVSAIGGKVPGGVLFCGLTMADQSNGSVTSSISSGCVTPSNFDKRIGQGFPLQLAPPTATPSQGFSPPLQSQGIAPGVGAFDPNLQTPTVHEWDLTIQQELPKGFIAEVGYIGKRGERLYRAYDLNQVHIGQPGFLPSFLIAQQNVLNGCKADGTRCPAGVTGTPPTLLLQLAGASFLNLSTTANNLKQNDIGTLANRIDSRTGSNSIVSRGFPANYFRPNAQFGQIFYFDSGGDSIFHGLIADVRRRFGSGLEFGLSYTYSKSIDDMSVDPVGASSGGAINASNSRTPLDVHNFHLDRSRSDFDNRHVLVGNGLWELPFGRGRRWGSNWPGLVSQTLGGWSFTGIYIFESGEPFTVNSGKRTENGARVSTAMLVGPVPDSSLKNVPGVEGPVLWNLTPKLDANNCKQIIGTQSSFCVPPAGTEGMGRNAAQGPGFWDFDFGALKKFDVTERLKLEFRAEFYNLFNHPNFENPRNASGGSNTLSSSVFGLTCCATSSLPSSANVIAIGEPQRVIQLALKLTF